MKDFIKPISSFPEGNFLGENFHLEKGDKFHTVTSEGKDFRVFEKIWSEAFSSGSWIQLGIRCRLKSESPEVIKIKKDQVNFDLIQTTLLSNIQVDANLYTPIKTGTYIDGFWSRKGGIMPGTNTMVTGDPGIGKSSVMMDVLQGIKITNPDKKVLYVSAEMTQIDMMDPDEFMKYYPGLFDKVEFLFAGDYIENEQGPNFSQALEVVLNRGYDVVVFDSMIEVQQICQEEFGLGSGKQAEKFMLNLMQKHNQAHNARKVYTAFLLIQQVKKDGEFVGSRRLEHMITAFLRIKWDAETRGRKYMEFRKNRRGQNKLRLYFKLGNGVEYDAKKFEDEIELADIMSKNEEVVETLNDLELVKLLQGENEDEDL
ncbi:MAG: hypothetical protein FGM61_05980 [Sediminibacterium sp.]|nr:hypothetical protein [Sediminibacterium sp.]